MRTREREYDERGNKDHRERAVRLEERVPIRPRTGQCGSLPRSLCAPVRALSEKHHRREKEERKKEKKLSRPVASSRAHNWVPHLHPRRLTCRGSKKPLSHPAFIDIIRDSIQTTKFGHRRATRPPLGAAIRTLSETQRRYACACLHTHTPTAFLGCVRGAETREARANPPA